MRKFFIVNYEELVQIIKYCVGNLEKQRKSVDGLQYIVLLADNNNKFPRILADKVCYTQQEAFELMQTKEWYYDETNG